MASAGRAHSGLNPGEQGLESGAERSLEVSCVLESGLSGVLESGASGRQLLAEPQSGAGEFSGKSVQFPGLGHRGK